MLCLGGKIVSVGTTKDALRDPWLKKNRKKVIEIDCAGKVVLPGFVDSHTHPVFVSPRLVDFEKRIEGASYEEIAAAGGGIRSSVEGVRGAGKQTLAEKVLATLQRHGRARHHDRRGQVGLRADGRVGTEVAGSHPRRCLATGRERSLPLCWARTSSQKNFRAAHKSTLSSSARR